MFFRTGLSVFRAGDVCSGKNRKQSRELYFTSVMTVQLQAQVSSLFFCLSLYKLHSLPAEFSFYSSSLFFKLVLYCKKVSFQIKTYIALYKVPQLCDVSAVKNSGFDIDIVKHYV